jgi:hypothetical protein
MRKTFDRRVVRDSVLDFVRACQVRVPCHLGGGAALSGDRAGFPPEQDLEAALRKDAGIDPGVLAWLLVRFPTHPLPMMLEPLTEDQLEEFRDALAERLRNIAL